MKTQATTINIADFCLAMQRGEILVNREYQRSDKVWPPQAKSFLIETIILDFPVPKLSLHQSVDLLSRETRKDIVDGQQRSRAILEFYEDKLRLSKTLTTSAIAGRVYSELDDETQTQFLDYGLNFDVFLGADSEDIREVFRRMNSFTVPLNPEETRHATYQGPFKWFIHETTREYDRGFRESGLFTEKLIIRMQDAKFLTELAHALIYGITTTTKASLNRIYKENNVDFPNAEAIDETLRAGLNHFLTEPAFWKTPLTKPHVAYSLVLAYCAVFGRVRLPGTYAPRASASFVTGDPVFNVLTLSAALDNDEEAVDEDLKPFVRASKDRTNVAEQRTTRFEYFLGALTA